MNFRKIYTTINLLWALPLALFIFWFINPFLLLRFGTISAEYFGHLVGDLELFLSEKEAGYHVPNKKHIDFWFNSNYKNKKSEILEKWKSKIIIIPSFIGIPLKASFELILKSKINIVKSKFYDRDVLGILEKTDSQLKLTQNEINLCNLKLNNIGLEDDCKVVALSIRDGSYHNEKEYTNYRNGNIFNLIETIKYLLENNYAVIKMGVTSEAAGVDFIINNKKYINYSDSNLKSQLMDLYIGWRCEFVISTGTGWDNIPTRVYRKPAIYIDYIHITSIPTWSKESSYIMKKIMLKNSGRVLNLREIFHLVENNFDTNRPILNQLHSQIEIINNTSTEILSAVKDFLNKKITTELQREFWLIYKECIKQYDLNQFHNSNIDSVNEHIEISASFIDRNKYLVDKGIGEDLLKLRLDYERNTLL